MIDVNKMSSKFQSIKSYSLIVSVLACESLLPKKAKMEVACATVADLRLVLTDRASSSAH